MSQRKLRSDFQQFTEDLHVQVLKATFAQREQSLRDLLTLATHIHKQYVNRYALADDAARLQWIDEQLSELSEFVASQRISAYFPDVRHRFAIFSKSFNESYLYVQQERCFATLPEDRFVIQEIKRIKRISRAIGIKRHDLSNRIRTLFGGSRTKPADLLHLVDWSMVCRLASNRVGSLLLDGITDDLKLRVGLAKCLIAISDAGLKEINKSEHLASAGEELGTYLIRVQEHIDGFRDEFTPALEHELDELYLKLIHAGTATASKDMVDVQKADQQADELRSRYANQLKAWDTDINTRLSQLGIDLGFQKYLFTIRNEVATAIDQIVVPYKNVLVPAVKNISNRLEKTADDFQELKSGGKPSRAALLKRVKQATTELNSYLNDELLAVLNQIIDSTDLSNRFEEAFAEIVLNNRLLTEETHVFDESGTEQNNDGSARTGTVKIDFRREITVYLNHELFRKMRLVPAKLFPMLDSMRKLGADITQIVDVNLEIADDLAASGKQSEAPLDELYDLIHDGLDRASERTKDLLEQINRFTAQTELLGSEHLDIFSQLCERIMREDDYLYIRTRNREVRVTSKAVDWKQRTVRLWNRTRDAAEAWGRLGLQYGRRQFLRLRTLLGFPSHEEGGSIIKSEASQFLASTDKSLRQLPLIYRRLFTSEPLQEIRFYKGRQQMQHLFEDAFGAWKEGTSTNLAIIGEKGSGKTTIVNLLQKHAESTGIAVVRGSIDYTLFTVDELLVQLCKIMGIEPVNDLDTFIKKINSLRTKKVVVMEGFQNIYMRFMHGFGALEAFLLIVTQTSGRVFWITTSSRYAWQYLDKIYDLNGYFTHKRFVDEVRADSLKDIIMSRHMVSGYELHFEPSQTVKDSRAYRKLSADETEQQTLLRNMYFERLHDVAKGNIAIAIQYWQLSVKEIRQDCIHIMPLDQLRLALGDGYSADDLFILGAIVMHDDLTVEEMAKSLHMDEAKSRIILAKLTARSILVLRDNRYYLNNLLYRPVVDLLKSKNILH